MTVTAAVIRLVGAADAADAADATDGLRVELSGAWTVAGLTGRIAELNRTLDTLPADRPIRWGLGEVEALDSAGAAFLWQRWGHRLPDALDAVPAHRTMLERWAGRTPAVAEPPLRRSLLDRVAGIGEGVLALRDHGLDFVALLGQLALDGLHLLRHPAETPWREISAHLYKAGVRAMPVTALVGFLIGVVLSYLSALQLRQFGADIFIINILGIGIIRELGPVLTAVLVAGRSGSAMTAQLGVMRVTEEIDALATMGVSRSLRLVLPKVLALAVAMPLLVLWTSALALVGGMVSAWLQLDISHAFFIDTLPKAAPVANLWIGQVKGIAFGIVVALIACHFGLRVRPNTESLSSNTTASVVTAITTVILVDAVFAVATRGIGVPKL